MPTENLFSLIVNVEEKFKLKIGQLYDELLLINELEVIVNASAEEVSEA